MTIIRTPQTSNFTICANGYANDLSLSAVAMAILHYLITKPPHWRFNATDIKRRFGIGLNKVYRCMRELISAGYATYKRTQAKVEWFIYDVPQTAETATAPAVSNRVNFEHNQNERILERTDKAERIEKTTTTPTPEPIAAEPVVVICESEELVYPEQLTPKQKTAVKSIAKQLKEPAMTQELLFTLAYAIANNHIKSSLPGYFRRLVDAANEGRYTATNTAGAPKPDNPNIAKTKELLSAYNTIKPTEPGKAAGFIAGLKAAIVGGSL